MNVLNHFVLRHMKALEMAGVLMRIFSFTLVSWLGPQSSFLFVWIFNTADAILLSYCAILKKDKAYTILNIFGFLSVLQGQASLCNNFVFALPIKYNHIKTT